VIAEGQIEEMGTHKELILKQGKYFNLYTKQFRHELEEQYDMFNQPEAVETA